jgi:hypothetical protein
MRHLQRTCGTGWSRTWMTWKCFRQGPTSLSKRKRPCPVWMTSRFLRSVVVIACCRRTMGEWLELILVEPKYYGTVLPRIPILTARNIKIKVCCVQFYRMFFRDRLVAVLFHECVCVCSVGCVAWLCSPRCLSSFIHRHHPSSCLCLCVLYLPFLLLLVLMPRRLTVLFACT